MAKTTPTPPYVANSLTTIFPTMKSFTMLVLATVAMMAMVNQVHSQGSAGTLMNAQLLYTAQASPVDPTSSEITFTGKWSHDGMIVLHVWDPNTTCTVYQGASICGNRALDATFTFRAVHNSGSRSDIVFDNVVDNVGPQNTGFVSDVEVAGFWDKDGDAEVYLSYKLTPYNKGVSAYAIVSLKNYYVGVVDEDNQNKFLGNTLLRANAYLVIGGVRQIDPYQMVLVPFDTMESGIINKAIPHRCLSPYSTTNPSKPVSGREISGTLSNVEFGAGNKFSAAAWIYSPNDGASFNRTGVIEGVMYLVPNYSKLYHIYASRFLDDQGGIHVLDNADVIISQ